MSFTFYAVNTIIKNITRIMCQVEDDQLAKIPLQGPLILVCNHINFIEVPLMYTHLQPRPISGYAKIETWNNPALRWLFNLWEGIPIRRGEPDKTALRQGLKMLSEGKIFAISPEGTRTGDGCLRRGLPGVVMLALHSGAPLLPMVYYGHEDYLQSFRRLRRSKFNIIVGKPFRLVAPEGKIKRDVRQQMVDEIMYQLAALLPESYRGEYANLSKATTQYLDFMESELLLSSEKV